MKLSQADSDLFFELMWSLQWYVNRETGILAGIKTVETYSQLSPEDRVQVRDRLFDEPEFIDKFIAENPCRFSTQQLDILASWKKFIRADFYLERYLKKHAIFIQEDSVYAVSGLSQEFSEMIHKSYLPLPVKAILLPFKDKIIYDGIFHHYNIHFGGNIRRRIKETYMRAKQNGEIIESLNVPASTPKSSTPSKQQREQQAELQKLLAEFSDKAAKLRGGGGQPPIYSPIFSLLRASIDLAQSAVETPDDVGMLQQKHDKTETALRKVETAIWRL